MKVRILSIEDGIDNVGFRKMSAFVRHLNPDTDVYYMPTGNVRGLIRVITMRGYTRQDEQDIRIIAETMAKSDIIGFSSMTPYAETTRRIIKEVRSINPKAYILWGGIHGIIHPEDAIQHADAVCTGEGEFAFERFYKDFQAGLDHTKTPGFWFNTPNGIKKNPNLPLQTPAEMDRLPHLTYLDGELIYRKNVRSFVPIDRSDFVEFAGLAYNTVWSIGCPLKCTYCGNTKFIENDNGYRRIRHSSVDYIIEEIRRATTKHPHISTIVFHDDSFMALRPAVLKEFATKFKTQIGLPFAVFGLIPNYVEADKVELLLDGGMNRVRMGVQSGSERILKFYKRPTPLHRIHNAIDILSRYSKYMMPPAYDIILDNPIETTEDTLATLDLLYEMPRPVAVNPFSLRVIPNTELEKDIKALGIQIRDITDMYGAHHPSFGNILLYLLVNFPLPRSLYAFLRKYVRPSHEPQREFKVLMLMLRTIFMVKRGLQHLRYMDFTVVTGSIAFRLWQVGLIGFWQRHMVRHFKAASESHGAEHDGRGMQQA